MIDLDLYFINPDVEEFLEPFQLNIRKPHSLIEIYISTASPYNNCLQKMYNIYNSTNLMEVQKDARI